MFSGEFGRMSSYSTFHSRHLLSKTTSQLLVAGTGAKSTVSHSHSSILKLRFNRHLSSRKVSLMSSNEYVVSDVRLLSQ